METTQGTIERLKREINYFERMIDDCINKYGFSKDSFLIEYYRMDIRQREQIYNKYKGRCAYCGDKIEFKDMQVDHFKPKHLGGKDEMDNYMPSCRACNFYKATFGLEEFRKRLENIPKQLEKIFIYKLAKKHCLVHQEHEHVVFLFEDVEYRRTHPEEDWA